MAQKFVLTYICPRCENIHGRGVDDVQTVTMYVRELLDVGCHTISIMDAGKYTEMLLDASEVMATIVPLTEEPGEE